MQQQRNCAKMPRYICVFYSHSFRHPPKMCNIQGRESRPTDGQKNKHTKNSHYHTQREHRREGKKYCFRTHPSKAICTLSKASCNHSDLPSFTHSELCREGNKLGCGRHPYRDEAMLPKHCCLLRTLGGKGPVRHNLKLLV